MSDKIQTEEDTNFFKALIAAANARKGEEETGSLTAEGLNRAFRIIEEQDQLREKNVAKS
jgi:hypothetical protein